MFFRLMGIYAHPDDEAFSLGGSLARAVAGGHAAALVCATRGEVGQIADAGLATPETLGQVREAELRRACAEVNVYDVAFLDYRDGQVASADHDEAVGRIVYHLRRFRPDVVVTFPPNGGYGHVDHMAIHRLTLAAVAAAADPSCFPAHHEINGLRAHRVRKVYYGAMPRERMAEWRAAAEQQGGQAFTPGGDQATIPLVEMGTPLAELTTRVTLDDGQIAAKERALRAHATQMPADGPFSRIPREQSRLVLGTEHFVLAPPPISDRVYATPEDDLFAGLAD